MGDRLVNFFNQSLGTKSFLLQNASPDLYHFSALPQDPWTEVGTFPNKIQGPNVS